MSDPYDLYSTDPVADLRMQFAAGQSNAQAKVVGVTDYMERRSRRRRVVRLERFKTPSGGTRQRWVAESFSAWQLRRGGTAVAEYVGYGRSRRAAIADISLRPYSMNFDSDEWKVRFESYEEVPS